MFSFRRKCLFVSGSRRLRRSFWEAGIDDAWRLYAGPIHDIATTFVVHSDFLPVEASPSPSAVYCENAATQTIACFADHLAMAGILSPGPDLESFACATTTQRIYIVRIIFVFLHPGCPFKLQPD